MPRARTSTATGKRAASKSATAKRSTRRATPKTTRSRATPTVTSRAARSSKFVCPECGRTFARAAALGAHRRVHGVAGSSTQAANGGTNRGKPANTRTAASTVSAPAAVAPRARRTAATADGVNRDGLLRSLFPHGIPANEEAIRAVSRWLDEADRLARLR